MTKRKTGKRRFPNTDAEVSFQYYEQLKEAIRDLKLIDLAIPREASRSCYAANKSGDVEAACIIEGRKADLLAFIQTICRDHIHYAEKLLKKGWTIEQWYQGFVGPDGKRRKLRERRSREGSSSNGKG